MNAIHDAALRRSGTHPPTSRRSQVRGSIVINAVIAMSLIVVVLIGTELGYLFYMKRELQKAADLSALAGTQILQSTNCGLAMGTASANAAKNLPFLTSQQYQVTAVCGEWSPTRYRDTVTHFNPAPPSADAINALHVMIIGTPSLIFPRLPGNESRSITVHAYAAKDAPLAAFSVGSKLIDINPEAPLISILKFVGADPRETCLVCYTGLAGIKITPGGLLEKLHIPVSADISVADLNTLLAANKVKIGDLLDAFVQLAGKDNLLAVNADLLASLVKAGLDAGSTKIQLGTTSSGAGGLFALIQAPTGNSALNVQVDAFDLLKTAVGIGTTNHAAEANTALNILGLSVSIEARVVEPPSIGIGGEGTTAYNSQVRVFIHVQTQQGQVLGDLLGALGTSINLPISIDVVNAFGTLKNINCDVPEATIEVNAPVLNACIGGISDTVLWSKANICTSADLTSIPLVRLLGIDLLKGSVWIPALDAKQTLTLSPGETKTTARNGLAIGDTLVALLKPLLGSQSAPAGPPSTPADRATTPAIAAKLADYYLTKGGNNVTSIRNLLTSDGMTWDRPSGLLSLFSAPMPDEWKAIVGGLPSLGGCTPLFGTPTAACMKTKLIASLQTPAQDGLVSGILNGVFNLVANLLGLGTTASGTPLLTAILGPLLQLLTPILNSIGSLVSNILGDTLGLELGRVDVHLQSLSCQNSKLVY